MNISNQWSLPIHTNLMYITVNINAQWSLPIHTNLMYNIPTSSALSDIVRSSEGYVYKITYTVPIYSNLEYNYIPSGPGPLSTSYGAVIRRPPKRPYQKFITLRCWVD